MKDAHDVMIKIYIRVYNELIIEIVDLLADGTPENNSDYILLLSIIAKQKQQNILKEFNMKAEKDK